MYTNGIKIGDNSYILSDEYGELTLLNGKIALEEIEEYIKLKNAYEDETVAYQCLQDALNEVHDLDKLSEKEDIEILAATIVIEGIFILFGALKLELNLAIRLLSIPLGTALISKLFIKPLLHGTKRARKIGEEEIKIEISRTKEKIKEIEEQINKLKEKIETESYFLQDEIIPVKTIRNEKTKVKMRVLKLNQNE